jgi:hypothetical protein
MNSFAETRDGGVRMEQPGEVKSEKSHRGMIIAFASFWILAGCLIMSLLYVASSQQERMEYFYQITVV